MAPSRRWSDAGQARGHLAVRRGCAVGDADRRPLFRRGTLRHARRVLTRESIGTELPGSTPPALVDLLRRCLSAILHASASRFGDVRPSGYTWRRRRYITVGIVNRQARGGCGGLAILVARLSRCHDRAVRDRRVEGPRAAKCGSPSRRDDRAAAIYQTGRWWLWVRRTVARARLAAASSRDLSHRRCRKASSGCPTVGRFGFGGRAGYGAVRDRRARPSSSATCPGRTRHQVCRRRLAPPVRARSSSTTACTDDARAEQPAATVPDPATGAGRLACHSGACAPGAQPAVRRASESGPDSSKVFAADPREHLVQEPEQSIEESTAYATSGTLLGGTSSQYDGTVGVRSLERLDATGAYYVEAGLSMPQRLDQCARSSTAGRDHVPYALLKWFAQDGKAPRPSARLRSSRRPELSPDGTQVAISARVALGLSVIDLARGTRVRLAAGERARPAGAGWPEHAQFGALSVTATRSTGVCGSTAGQVSKSGVAFARRVPVLLRSLQADD